MPEAIVAVRTLADTLGMMNDKKHGKTYLSSETEGMSDLFHLLNLTVDVYHNAKICGNWEINEHELGATCFHMVTMGSCLLDVPGHFNLQLNSKDLVIFPRELPHHMTAMQPNQGAQQHLDYKDAIHIDGTGMLCGSVRLLHQTSNFLLDSLPPVFIIPYDPRNLWVEPLSNMILMESMNTGPASKAILDKLSEVLFVYALRQYVIDSPENAGLLALYSHKRLSSAIHAIHSAPEKAWTLANMAREASLSRTVFAETFKSVSSWTPGQYLTWWRMQLAWDKLKHGEQLLNVAEAIGYKSEAAFSRAFSRHFETSPSKVKRAK